jgi:uncharacterized protein YkwD
VLNVRSFLVCLALAAAVFTTVTCTDRLELVRGQASLSVAPQAAQSGAAGSAPQAPAPPPTAAPPSTATPAATQTAATATPQVARATSKPTATRPPVASSTPVPAPPAASGSGSVQQQLTNQARAAAGLAPLQWNACLAGVAQRHASEMAQAGHIYHGDGVQQDLGCGQGYSRAGENVGMTSPGIDDNRIFQGFMNSAGHKANILGSYRYIGTAWVLGPDGAGYVSVEFAG